MSTNEEGAPARGAHLQTEFPSLLPQTITPQQAGVPCAHNCPCGRYALHWEIVGNGHNGVAAGVAQGVVDPALAARAQEIAAQLGGDSFSGETLALIVSALTENEQGVEASVAKAKEAQAAGRVSNPTGLLVTMVRSGDHRKLGQPAGERCRICGNPDAENFARFNGGDPLYLCAYDAGQLSPGGDPRTFAELAAELAPAN